MGFLPFILKHLRANWIRTLSTVLAMAVCIFLFATLQTLIAAATGNVTNPGAHRLITRHNVSLGFQLPYAYKERIGAISGVKRVSVSNWFGGVRDLAQPRNFFPNFAVEAESFLSMYPEYHLEPDRLQAFLGDLRGCVIGPDVAEKFKLKEGDPLTLQSNLYRTGKPFEFVVRGVYRVDQRRYPGANQNLMLFHFKYLDEATGGHLSVGTYRIEIADQEQAARISHAIDGLFENSDAQTHTDTEAAFGAAFMSLGGNLVLLLNGIGLAVMFTVLLVTGNTMSMAIRERRTEIGVLKTLGFPAGLVLRLIVAEAAAIGALGGILGVVLAQFATKIFVKLPMIGDLLRGVASLGLPLSTAALGVSIAVLLGLAAGLVPALFAYQARIVDLIREA